MNPRLSTPMTRSMPAFSNGPAIASIVERNPSRSRSSVVMSKKLIPALGKSGTERILSFNDSIWLPHDRERVIGAGRRQLERVDVIHPRAGGTSPERHLEAQ